MKREFKNFVMVLLLISASFATPFLYDQGTGARDSNGLVEQGNLTVQIWDSPTGGALLWEKNYTNAIINGSWVVLLDNLSFLTYSGVFYKDYKINGVDMDYDGNERIAWFSPLGIINSNSINSSQIQLRVNGTCPTGYAMTSINEDGSVNCIALSSGLSDTEPPYLYNNSTTIFFNETKLNDTIDARATSVWTNDSSYTYVKSSYPKQLRSDGYLDLGSWVVAVGNGATSTGYNSLAVGINSLASGSRSATVGYSARATGYASASFGWSAEATGYASLSIGYVSSSNATSSVALGYGSHAYGDNALAIGSHSVAREKNSLAIGENSESNEESLAVLKFNKFNLIPQNETNTFLRVNGSINVTNGNDICIEDGTCLSSLSGTGNNQLWNQTGTIITPSNNSVNQILLNNSFNGYTELKLINTNDSGNGAGAVLELKGSGADNTNNLYLGKYGGSFWIPLFAGNGVLMTDKNLVVGSVGTGSYGNIKFLSGDSYTNPNVVATLNKTEFNISTLVKSVNLSVKDTSVDGGIMTLEDSDAVCVADPETTGVVWSCSSDKRLKDNIHPASSAIPYLLDIPIREYIVKKSGELETGVIAQELIRIHPELVSINKNGYYTVKQISVWKLVKAIQEQQKEIEELKNKNKKMEEEIKGLKVLVCQDHPDAEICK